MAGTTGFEPATSGLTGRRTLQAVLRPQGIGPGFRLRPTHCSGATVSDNPDLGREIEGTKTGILWRRSFAAISIEGCAPLTTDLCPTRSSNREFAWALCDTDSMAIVCSTRAEPIPCPTPDGVHHIQPLTPDDIRAILRRFDPLNPYDPGLIADLWKQEHQSLDDPVWCYAISAKRYVLYRTRSNGTPKLVYTTEGGRPDDGDGVELVDWSEHGLGAYLNPLSPDRQSDEEGRRRPEWIRQAWEWTIAGGSREDLPDWADAYALTRFSLSSPSISPWFDGYNRNQPRSSQIRPATFGLLAHPDGFLYGGSENRPRPAAPYEADPDEWADLPWYDRNTGQPVSITTLTPHDPAFLSQLTEGRIRIRTLGDVVVEFRRRPEHKSLAPDGQPATSQTRGFLRRRPIESAPVITDLIGKEGNELAERGNGLTTDANLYQSQYGNRGDRWGELVLPILKELGPVELMKRTGRARSTVYEVISGKRPTYSGPASKYADAAVSEATRRLQRSGKRVPRNKFGTLYYASRLTG